MHVHRTLWKRGFTVLPNSLLQDRVMTFTAKGVLVDLLSRPDGWREDGRQMADNSSTGRGSVARARRDLARLGYYRVDVVQQPDGTLVSETHVFDRPQMPPLPRPGSKTLSGKRIGGKRPGGKGQTPDTAHAGPGESCTGGAVVITKDQETEYGEKEPPSLPAPADDARDVAAAPAAVPAAPAAPAAPTALVVAETSPQTREAVATLFRVLRPEPRLRLGEPEALAPAPLVAEWLSLGATECDLAAALLQDLPTPIHAPAKLLRNRLTRKCPPAPSLAAPAQRRPPRCRTCSVPIPEAGICRACAGLAPRRTPVDSRTDTGIGPSVTARGIARVRAALRGTGPRAVSGVCAYGRGALTPAPGPARAHRSPLALPRAKTVDLLTLCR